MNVFALSGIVYSFYQIILVLFNISRYMMPCERFGDLSSIIVYQLLLIIANTDNLISNHQYNMSV